MDKVFIKCIDKDSCYSNRNEVLSIFCQYFLSILRRGTYSCVPHLKSSHNSKYFRHSMTRSRHQTSHPSSKKKFFPYKYKRCSHIFLAPTRSREPYEELDVGADKLTFCNQCAVLLGGVVAHKMTLWDFGLGLWTLNRDLDSGLSNVYVQY